MQVRALSPTKESRRTRVSLEARKGRCEDFLPMARMHSLRARRDLLISAASMRVLRSEPPTLAQFIVSAPRSFPARSMSENFPWSFPVPPRGCFLRRMIWANNA